MSRPSLADLIEEHSNQSLENRSILSASHSNLPFRETLVSSTLSLSELAFQHQCNTSQSSEPPSRGSIAPSESASQHPKQTIEALTLGTNFALSALNKPPSLSDLLTAPHATTEHKGKTSATSNRSEYSLGLLLSPTKPEEASVSAENVTEDNNGNKMAKVNPSMDIGALISQSHGLGYQYYNMNLPSPTSVNRGLDSVFAKPSLFALTLSFRSRKQTKRKLLNRKILQHHVGRFNFAATERPTIVPFSFDTPSPDDIVRANQSKAFTR